MKNAKEARQRRVITYTGLAGIRGSKGVSKSKSMLEIENIGDELHKIMNSRSRMMSAEEFGELIGVSGRQIRRIVDGHTKKIRIGTLREITNELGLDFNIADGRISFFEPDDVGKLTAIERDLLKKSRSMTPEKFTELISYAEKLLGGGASDREAKRQDRQSPSEEPEQ